MTRDAQAVAIRVAVPSDEVAVTELLAASYPALLAGSYDPDLLAQLLPVITRANPRLLASGTYYVAQAPDGQVVGCGGWTHEKPWTNEIEPGLAHIRHVGVHPDWGQRGVGRALYERCEVMARADGASAFECYSSLNARAFYEALGFVTIQPIDVPMPGPLVFPSLAMRRPI
jgi:ribosomal protein S18 acetylase RimI-like enzyme